MTIERKGEAQNVDYGSAAMETGGLTVVTSYNVEETYATQQPYRDSDGAVTGFLLGDKTTTGTISGYGQSVSMSLGGAATNNSGVGSSSEAIITSIRASGANDDFVTYELGFSAFEGAQLTCDKKCKNRIESFKDAPALDEVGECAHILSRL